MTLILEPACFKCKHFNINKHSCQAFPKGIPDVIAVGSNTHKKPLPSQGNKIVFEPKIVFSNDHFKNLHLCETCSCYIRDKVCFAFDSIPDKYWDKMFITNKPNHTKLVKGQYFEHVYSLSWTYSMELQPFFGQRVKQHLIN